LHIGMWPTEQCEDVFDRMSLITFFSFFCNLIGAAKILQRGRVRYSRDARPSHACALGSGCARLASHIIHVFPMCVPHNMHMCIL